MTTRTPKRYTDRRPEKVKAMSSKLQKTKFPKCYGYCPDNDRKCPPEEEFNKFLKEHRCIFFRDLPSNWECKTCIYADTL